MLKFEAGDIVEWDTGRNKIVYGEVVEIVSPGNIPDSKFIKLHNMIVKSGIKPREHESYVVKSEKRYKWPLVNKLQLRKKRENISQNAINWMQNNFDSLRKRKRFFSSKEYLELTYIDDNLQEHIYEFDSVQELFDNIESIING